MESVMSAGVVLILVLAVFAVLFWYSKEVARVLRPIGRMLDAGDVHAQVYAASVQNNAVMKASKLEVDTKAYAKAKSNLKTISSFSFDDFDTEEATKDTK